MRNQIKTIIRWSNLALIVITLAAYLSPYINPNTFWLFSLLGLAYPLLLFANLGFITLWISRKKWYFLFSVACIGLGWNFLSKSIGFNTKSNASSDDTSIVTFNTESAHKFWDYKAKRTDLQKFTDYLQSMDADIICLQEFPIRGELRLKRDEAWMHSYQATGKNMVTYSKYPILKHGYFAFVNEYNGCLFTDLKIGEQILRVYNVHLSSNKITNIANEVAENGDWKERETWSKVKQMLLGYRSAAKKRSDQAEEIGKHIAASPYPVIVCGDFNDVPLSYAYHTIAENLTDHFQARGRGLGTTFGGSIPFLKIDYILGSPSVAVSTSDILHHDYSDHYPIRSMVSLK